MQWIGAETRKTGSYRQQTHHTKQTVSNVLWPEICLLLHFLQQLPFCGVSLSPASNLSGFPLACEQDQKLLRFSALKGFSFSDQTWPRNSEVFPSFSVFWVKFQKSSEKLERGEDSTSLKWQIGRQHNRARNPRPRVLLSPEPPFILKSLYLIWRFPEEGPTHLLH